MDADEFVVHPIRALTVDRSSRSPLMIDKPDPHSYLVLSAPSSSFATAFLPFPSHLCHLGKTQQGQSSPPPKSGPELQRRQKDVIATSSP